MADTDETDLSIIEIGDLLKVLREHKVHSFQGAGLTVVFEEPDPNVPSALEAKNLEPDDAHGTSNRRVGGFRDPSLYPHTNGKSLTFKGTLE